MIKKLSHLEIGVNKNLENLFYLELFIVEINTVFSYYNHVIVKIF